MKWVDSLLGPKNAFKLECRVLNAILFCSMVFGLLSFLNDLIIQPTSFFTLISFLTVSVFGGLYYLGRKRQKNERLVLPYLIIYIILMTAIWKTTGGLMGPVLMYFVALIFITPIITRGDLRTFTLIFHFLYLFMLFMLELKDLSYVQNIYENALQEKIDTFASVIYLSIVAFIVISLVITSYEKQKEKTESLNAAKDKFFSIIAHDLRGPIGSISNLGRILLEQGDNLDEDGKKDFIRHLYKSSRETHLLLDNLLKWARSESPDLSINRETIHLLECIDETSKVLQECIRQKNIELHMDIEQDHIAFADKNMIKTVIRNILSNAIKFTNDGGKISISTVQLNQSQIQIRIKDTGIGIAEEAKSLIFENPQIRGGVGSINDIGIGLGLHISKLFVEKNKGHISLESELEKGTTFLISLPVGEN